MKNIVIGIMIIAIASLFLLGVSSSTDENDKYLRIHIRADSDNENDQNVKLIVRDSVVNYLAPYLAQTLDKQSALNIVASKLGDIKSLCDSVLSQYGKQYTSRVYLSREVFPTREYEEVTLARGVYDALIIELGSGEGQNWWCVVYPPLCFVNFESTDSGKLHYKSKLKEIIDSFFNS